MRVTLTKKDGSVLDAEPFDQHALVRGSCPSCNKTPFSVVGLGMETESHDTYRAEAVCVTCRERVGVLRVSVNTIFGIEEDERVLSGPWKVY